MSGPGLIVGIETSCDETAIALVEAGTTVRSSVVSSQIDLHARFGGVVPEIAGRAHLERIGHVFHAALEDAGLDPATLRGAGLAGIAATVGPGLIGALLVGVSFAKSLAQAYGVPFVGVNHLEGHLYAALLEDPQLELPALVLLVSGGHTLLVAMEAPGRYEIVGQTIDDAAGEAFDKVARYLGLTYPGGPAIEIAARSGNPAAVAFPRPMLADGLDCSFSGLKTAVIQHVRAHPEVETADVAASFQEAVVDVLTKKALSAAKSIGARGICLAGGVAANGPLRERIAAEAAAVGLRVSLPSRAMCTDNAAMIAAAGWYRLQRSGPTPLDCGATPGLRLSAAG